MPQSAFPLFWKAYELAHLVLVHTYVRQSFYASIWMSFSWFHIVLGNVGATVKLHSGVWQAGRLWPAWIFAAFKAICFISQTVYSFFFLILWNKNLEWHMLYFSFFAFHFLVWFLKIYSHLLIWIFLCLPKTFIFIKAVFIYPPLEAVPGRW